jgi:hypothetical protein
MTSNVSSSRQPDAPREIYIYKILKPNGLRTVVRRLRIELEIYYTSRALGFHDEIWMLYPKYFGLQAGCEVCINLFLAKDIPSYLYFENYFLDSCRPEFHSKPENEDTQ